MDFLEKHKEYLEKAMSYYYNDDLFIKFYNKIPKSRYNTFKYCYDYFKDKNPIIVELGTTRSYIDGRYYDNIIKKIGRDLTDDDCDNPELMEWNNNNPEKWDWSAGFFTKIFSNIFPNSIIHTIDIMKRHLKRCKIMNEDRNNIVYHCISSEDFLNNFIEKIDLLYIHSNINEETAQLNLREVKIIIEKNILSDKGLILIDNVRNPYMMINGEENNLGTSKYSIPYLIENGYKIIKSEYQIILSKCPYIEHWEYTLNEWSNYYNLFLDIIFKEDINIIYDIGANLGGTSYVLLEYAKKYNKNINKIYCFEPDDNNIEFLKNKLNKEINNGTIIPIHKGIYYGLNESKAFGMSANNKNFVCKNVGGMGVEECMINIRDERNKNGENVMCDQVDNKIFKLDTLENLCKDFELPDFIKIDVEGAEKNILINSEIIKTTKYIIVEWNQSEKINDFLLKYLPNFELLGKFGNDYLLKNIIIK